jgi:hypothetical protein
MLAGIAVDPIPNGPTGGTIYMHSTAGSVARNAIFVAGAAGALAGIGSATASAATGVAHEDAAVVRHIGSGDSRVASHFHPQGGARRRSAYEPVRPSALGWGQVMQIQGLRSDPHLSAKSAGPSR